MSVIRKDVFVLFVLFMILWLIFNERVTWEIVIFGAAVSLLMDLFCRVILGRPGKKSASTHLRLFIGGVRYAVYLLGEIYRCNIAVMKLIFSPALEPEPELHYFKTRLRTDSARVVLANSITITPGTITCRLEDDTLCVHALDKSFAEGIDSSTIERKLLELEEISHAAE